MTTDGGGVAAFGYRYQYLVTAEEVLRILASGIVDLDSVVLIVEPTRADLKSGSDADNDVVDFAIEINGQVTQRVQVKSSRVPSKLNPSNTPMSAPSSSGWGPEAKRPPCSPTSRLRKT